MVGASCGSSVSTLETLPGRSLAPRASSGRGVNCTHIYANRVPEGGAVHTSTTDNLAEPIGIDGLCREQFPRPVVWAMWVVSEVAAMATDLAEFLGGAIGLSLLFQLPLFAGMVVTGIVTYGI